MTEKTHFRKAFNSPYLSSADIVEPIVLTIDHVALEPDRTKRTKELFNTAHFVEKEIRAGEKLKPMILNSSNCKTVKGMTQTSWIEDWLNIQVTIYVAQNVPYGKETVEGLRISPHKPEKKLLTPQHKAQWARAKAAYIRDGNLNSVLARVAISQENEELLIAECTQKQEPVEESEAGVNG